MNITVVVIGKTNASYMQEGIELYLKRLRQFAAVKLEVIDPPKRIYKLSQKEILLKEKDALLKSWNTKGINILLDEHGKQFSSLEFSTWIELQSVKGNSNMHFYVGGAYGFHEDLKKEAHQLIALSKMTFSHQMIRLFMLEQIYRAFSIINNHPYHNG